MCQWGISQGGTPLVDGKLETLQWEENSATRTPYHHSDRYLIKRQSAYCKGFSTGRKWSKEEKHFHINVLELLALKFAILSNVLHKEFVTLDHSCSSGQQSCSDVSLEDGWYPQSTAFKNQQVNLELSAISSDHNYCRGCMSE